MTSVFKNQLGDLMTQSLTHTDNLVALLNKAMLLKESLEESFSD